MSLPKRTPCHTPGTGAGRNFGGHCSEGRRRRLSLLHFLSVVCVCVWPWPSCTASEVQCSISDRIRTGCRNELSEVASRCEWSSLVGDTNHCNSLPSKNSLDVAGAKWSQAHLVLKLSASAPAKPGYTGGELECFAMQFQVAMLQFGAGLQAVPVRSRRTSALDSQPKPDASDSVLVEAGQADERPALPQTSGSSTGGMQVDVELLSVRAKHEHTKFHVDVLQQTKGQTSPVILVTGKYNRSKASLPIRINMCLAYQLYSPEGENAKLVEGSENTFSTTPPLLMSIIQDFSLECQSCPKPTAPTRMQATPAQAGVATVQETELEVQTTDDVTITSPPPTSPEVDAITNPVYQLTNSQAVSSMQTTHVRRPVTTARAKTPPATHTLSPTASTVQRSVPSSHKTITSAHFTKPSPRPTTSAKRPGPTNAGAAAAGNIHASPASDDDLMLFVTGNRLYVTAAILALIVLLIVLVIILLVVNRRAGKRQRSPSSPGKMRPLSPDIPSAFSTLVSSTNTTGTRVSAAGTISSKTKPAANVPLDLDFSQVDMSSTFPRVSMLNSAEDAVEDQTLMHYHSSNIFTTSTGAGRAVHSVSASSQNVDQTEQGSDDTSDVLFYTVSSKPAGGRAGYSALTPGTTEGASPYTNIYNSPTQTNPKLSKKGDVSKKSFKSKKSMSLDAVPTSTSSLPRNILKSDGGNESDNSDTFPELPPSQRGSVKNVEEQGSQGGWPDFSTFPAPADDYATLNADPPIPAATRKLSSS